MSGDGLEVCKYRPDRGVDYYASGLAGILRVVVGPGRDSTHAYVKEVRRALETLVFSIWDRSDEYIPVVAEANIPDSLRSARARDCFRELLIGLMRRFRESTSDLPIGSRIRLMNMTISAIAEMARYGRLPPVGEEIVSIVFSKSGSPDSPSGSEGGGEA